MRYGAEAKKTAIRKQGNGEKPINSELCKPRTILTVETKENPGTVKEENACVRRKAISHGQKLKRVHEVTIMTQMNGSVKRGQKECKRKLRGTVTTSANKINEKSGF
jgi:hypothetical protein